MQQSRIIIAVGDLGESSEFDVGGYDVIRVL